MVILLCVIFHFILFIVILQEPFRRVSFIAVSVCQNVIAPVCYRKGSVVSQSVSQAVFSRGKDVLVSKDGTIL